MPGLPIGPLELVLILGIALLILGPGKLPEVGSALGRTIREFRRASTDIQDATNLSPDAGRGAVPSGPAETTPAPPADAGSDAPCGPASPARDDA
jgi:sec-independent protein translocase protein TatA